MTKKLIALSFVAVLILGLVSYTALAADERDVIVVYPGFNASGKPVANGDENSTPESGGRFMIIATSSLNGTRDFPVTDSRILRNPGSLQTATKPNTSGYTLYSPGTIENNNGFIYKPCASSATNTEGWYDVYVERLLYYNTAREQKQPDAMHVDVIHRDGTAHYLMDMTPNSNYSDATKYADIVKIGTFFFDNANSHQVRLLFPIDKSMGTSTVRYDIGGVMFVPSEEPKEKSYFKPVFSDDFSDGIAPVWYEISENAKYYLSSHSINIPAGESFRINYAEGEDAAEAVSFTEGAINFRIWWRNQSKNDAYTSVILGKSKEKTAEFRIYSEKLVYAQNGVEIDEIPIHGFYALYYNSGENSANHVSWRNTLSGYIDTENSKSYYPHMMRLEITNPEALGNDGGSITDNLKTVKLIVNYGTPNAMVMAMGSLPENSILYDTDNDPTDNYIEFKNVAGITDNKDIDINNISVMIPSDIKSKSVYAESINNLKYTKSSDELSLYTGILGVEAVVSNPCEVTNTLLKSDTYSDIAIMTPYYLSGRLASAPVIRNLEIMPGTKKKLTMSIDTHADDMDKVKFFIWDNFNNIIPAKEAESSVIY